MDTKDNTIGNNSNNNIVIPVQSPKPLRLALLAVERLQNNKEKGEATNNNNKFPTK